MGQRACMYRWRSGELTRIDTGCISISISNSDQVATLVSVLNRRASALYDLKGGDQVFVTDLTGDIVRTFDILEPDPKVRVIER